MDSDISRPEPRNDAGEDNDARAGIVDNDAQGLVSRPRHLCYIPDLEQDKFITINVEREGHGLDLEFVFVSYTRTQFCVATEEENLERHSDETTRQAYDELSTSDREQLLQWGLDAAKKAGKRAFWIDFECVVDQDNVARSASKSADVYRICDVVRAAHSMIIATGPPVSEKIDAILAGQVYAQIYAQAASQHPESKKWLRQWGSRLWTLPELLLCPDEHNIKLYVFGESEEKERAKRAKRNFAEEAGHDARLVEELLFHFNGSAVLSPMNLISTALACFSGRSMDKFTSGDIAYALMGLFPVSQRPKIRPSDSGFQAFARLSRDNDGSEFLSRMVCLLPPSSSDKPLAWFESVNDVWGAKIRDVHPSSYVIDLADDSPDTLIMNQTPSIAIRWDGFDANSIRSGELPQSLLLIAPFTWIGVVLVSMMLSLSVVEHESRMDWPAMRLTNSVVFVLSALLAPVLYLWAQTRAWEHRTKSDLVGIEGHVDAAAVEKHLWGFNHGRLAQAESAPGGGGTYSDSDNASASQQPAAVAHRCAEEFKFTLVDTRMMTITHITARRPPVALFIVGSERDHQRAILCSYDWRDNTFERETVLRVEGKMLDYMTRSDQFRLRLHSPDPSASASANASDLGSSAAVKMTSQATVAHETVQSWKLELLFATITLVSPPLVHNSPQQKDGMLSYNQRILTRNKKSCSSRQKCSLTLLWTFRVMKDQPRGLGLLISLVLHRSKSLRLHSSCIAH